MRAEPARYRAKDALTRLGPPYDDMVERLHDRMLELLVPAREGNRQGVLACAERVLGQCGALVALLSEKKNKEKTDDCR